MLADTKPDVLFLDIRMPGLSGVEVAEMALDEEAPPLIVFITSHDEYAAKAFDLAAVDYVLKVPDVAVFETRVAEAVQRVQQALEQRAPVLRELREQLALLAQQQPQLGVRKLAVKDYEEGTLRVIPAASVVCVERTGGHVVLRTVQRAFRTNTTVDRLEQRLAPAGFVRVSRSALVNVDYIDHLIPSGDGSYDALLKDEQRTVVTVSRSRSKALLEILGL